MASLGYVITFVDDQSVSFMRPYMGWAPMAPVVHAVILPIDKEITRLEVIGQRNEYQYNWHVMAQTFLTQMDAWLKRKT